MMSDSRGALQRLFKELTKWRKDQARVSASGQNTSSSSSNNNNNNNDNSENLGIERLGPVDEDNLFRWEAVINGRGLGGGYDSGRWLLSITIPPNYPHHPPAIVFVTPVVHANVNLRTGEICLDLLAPQGGWTPVCGIAQCVRDVRALLAHPEPASPLNVDVAALLNAGDKVGARALVEYWCVAKQGGRYEGR